MGSPTPRTKVFISYSHNDREQLFGDISAEWLREETP